MEIRDSGARSEILDSRAMADTTSDGYAAAARTAANSSIAADRTPSRRPRHVARTRAVSPEAGRDLNGCGTVRSTS